MPDENGFVTGDARVDAALKRLQERNDARFQALEDALLVQVQLEKRMGQLIKDQAEYLTSHEARLKQLADRDAALDARIEKFVSGMGEFLTRMNLEHRVAALEA